MTALPGLSTLPAVDRRHHGRHVGTGTAAGEAPRCQTDDQLAGVDRRHRGDRGTREP